MNKINYDLVYRKLLLLHGPYLELPEPEPLYDPNYTEIVSACFAKRREWRHTFKQLTGYEFDLGEEVQWDHWWEQEQQRHVGNQI